MHDGHRVGLPIVPGGYPVNEIPSHIIDALADLGLEGEALSGGGWGVRLECERRPPMQIAMHWGERTATFTAFFMRCPDRNHEAVFGRLLAKNLATYRWAFAVDDLGDVFMVARIPVGELDGDALDELLGLAVVYADEVYEPCVRTGFDIPPGVSVTGPPPPPPQDH